MAVDQAGPSAGGRDCFAIALRDKPADGALPLSARATITGGAGALDVMLSLPPNLEAARRLRDRLKLSTLEEEP